MLISGTSTPTMGVINNLISLALIGTVASQSIPIDEYKQLLLDESNEYRRKPNATNMAKLQWDDTLASEAAQWISGCRFENTPYLKRGENLAFSSDTGDNEAMIREVLQAWYDEVNQYNYAGKKCGSRSCHYTQMVWAKTRKIGCAIQKCASLFTGFGAPLQNGWYLGCFYDPKGNWVDEYPYEHGTRCTDCLNGQTCDNLLCVGEPVL